MLQARIVIVAILLAGCAEPTQEPIEVEAEIPGIGTIAGTVVTEAIVPIEGAEVFIEGIPTQTTGADGAFLFVELSVGTYLVEATAPYYLTVQTLVTVEPGELFKMQVQLPADPAGTPYFEERMWSGYIECGTNLIAACAHLADVGIGEDGFSGFLDVDNNITHLQGEMVWTSSQQLGDRLELVHRYGTQEQHDELLFKGEFGRIIGASPLLLVTSADMANNVNLGTQYEFIAAVFAAPATDGVPLGAAAAQDFEYFLHVFHAYRPPSDWRFTDGDEIPGP